MPDRTIYAPSREYAERVAALLTVHPDGADWRAGSSEPWIARLVASLIIANDCTRVVEVGGFRGYTTRHIAEALCCLPHPTDLTVCEIDWQRANDVNAVLDEFRGAEFTGRVAVADSLTWIPTLADESVDFVWLDGNHEHAHVAREIQLLEGKLAPGGIIAGHDTHGVCALEQEFRAAEGYALDLPRLGPAGGIGLIQRPR